MTSRKIATSRNWQARNLWSTLNLRLLPWPIPVSPRSPSMPPKVQVLDTLVKSHRTQQQPLSPLEDLQFTQKLCNRVESIWTTQPQPSRFRPTQREVLVRYCTLRVKSIRLSSRIKSLILVQFLVHLGPALAHRWLPQSQLASVV